jgi:hypothetical protein
MNDPITAELRVADRLLERVREADRERRLHHAAISSPPLARRLAVALRGAADRLDSPPRDTRLGRIPAG